MIKPSEAQGWIKDLSFAQKSLALHIELRIVDDMNFDAEKVRWCFTKYYNYIDESYFELQNHCKGCVDNKPDQQVR